MPVFDQGYQHWKGELAGHGWHWLTIMRHGVRIGMKNRLLRLLLLFLMPALALAGVIALWGLVEQKFPLAVTLLRAFGVMRDLVDEPAAFRITAWTLCFHFFILVEMYYIMVLVLLVGPNLISQDLRYNALPLYLSRPLRRIDYFLGKLGVVAFFLGLVAVLPAIVAWVLGLLCSLNFQAVVQTFRLLTALVLFGVIVSASAGLLILALSSLSRNSRHVAAFWGGLWFVTSIVSGTVDGIYQDSVRRQLWRSQDNVVRKQNELTNLMNQQRQDMVKPQADHGNGQHRKRELLEVEQKPKDVKQPAEEKKLRDERIAQLQKELEHAMEESKKRQEEVDDIQRDDWRPIISYTNNLERIGFALIGSQGAFEKVDEITGLRQQNGQNPINVRRPRLTTMMVPQYPWYWSALVLLGLGGLSLWILHKRVTTLDRLR